MCPIPISMENANVSRGLFRDNWAIYNLLISHLSLNHVVRFLFMSCFTRNSCVFFCFGNCPPIRLIITKKSSYLGLHTELENTSCGWISSCGGRNFILGRQKFFLTLLHFGVIFGGNCFFFFLPKGAKKTTGSRRGELANPTPLGPLVG